ncbi:daunorubicin resistance protein DrrA family ABC transporter ATP-binding protein [Glycomyces endophyticus]|uniref:Daunorubicin resistance protein DrrA family ABC transporter ATP-binding protein n=1 Tax=Glycomyces endophyticus TaxID=480996 RepID=A0ABP4T242_9ACTN
MTDTVVAVSGLRKAFGRNAVLDGVDLAVPAGAVVALLGPGESGKSTLVDVLTARTAPDDGTVRVCGHDAALEPAAVRALVGAAAPIGDADAALTGSALLRRAGPPPPGLLDRLGLTGALNRPVATYSGGERRRFALALALAGGPPVVLLDEPTLGLDAADRRTVRAIVRDLAAGGAAVLVTTGCLAEADRLADEVAVLDRGRVVARCTVEELKRRIPERHVRLRFATEYEFAAAARVLSDAVAGEEPLVLRVPGDGGTRSLRSLLDRLDEYALSAAEWSVPESDLDDVLAALSRAAA